MDALAKESAHTILGLLPALILIAIRGTAFIIALFMNAYRCITRQMDSH